MCGTENYSLKRFAAVLQRENVERSSYKPDGFYKFALKCKRLLSQYDYYSIQAILPKCMDITLRPRKNLAKMHGRQIGSAKLLLIGKAKIHFFRA